MARILITGAVGFIGYHLAKRLAEADHELVLVDDLSRGKRDTAFEALLSPKVSFIKADLSERASWDSLGLDFDYVYHLAAVNGTELFYTMPQEVLRVDIMTSLNAVEWMRQKNPKGKILFTSSSEAYAGALEAFGQLPFPTPENVPLVVSDVFNPRWSYGGTKLIGELLCINYSRAYGFRMSIVRPHNFYGPRAGNLHVIPEFISRALSKTDPFPVLGLTGARSFCYIDDAVEGLIAVMESEKTDGGIFNIDAQEEKSIKELLEVIFTEVNWRPKTIEEKPMRQGSVKRRLGAIEKIHEVTGWQPKTSFQDGIRRTVLWYTTNPES